MQRKLVTLTDDLQVFWMWQAAGKDRKYE